jgi:hypothetical protein
MLVLHVVIVSHWYLSSHKQNLNMQVSRNGLPGTQPKNQLLTVLRRGKNGRGTSKNDREKAWPSIYHSILYDVCQQLPFNAT